MRVLRSCACAATASRSNVTEILSNMDSFFLLQALHERPDGGNRPVHRVGSDGETRGDFSQVSLHLPANAFIPENSPRLFGEPCSCKLGLHQFRYNFSSGH